MKTSLAILIALVVGVVGFILGATWQNFRNYETYVYRFSQYSRHLHELVKEQQIEQLTNDIVLFDTRFIPHQDDPRQLEDVMFQILKLGPYYQSDTNKNVKVKGSILEK